MCKCIANLGAGCGVSVLHWRRGGEGAGGRASASQLCKCHVARSSLRAVGSVLNCTPLFIQFKIPDFQFIIPTCSLEISFF